MEKTKKCQNSGICGRFNLACYPLMHKVSGGGPGGGLSVGSPKQLKKLVNHSTIGKAQNLHFTMSWPPPAPPLDFHLVWLLSSC